MASRIILASTSQIRAEMLSNARIEFTTEKPRVDEEAIKAALQAEQAPPRDIADTLAEYKARKVSQKHLDAIVIGCDQVLDFKGDILSKPQSPEHAQEQLKMLSNDRHQLLSAAVIYEDGKPVWRHVGVVRLQMRALSDDFIVDYVARNWDDIRHCVGAYQLEKEGVRLFTRVDGDYFNVLGMPLLELISYLTLRGELPS
ncbi:Maf family protein [Falsihalocynthiibacter sp. SS001]|uniref:Maf family protein n=1 Tax=Falsihalocynthiibacter sp. SS001 TaxID=3349698 RepID=UPI0036D28157